MGGHFVKMGWLVLAWSLTGCGGDSAGSGAEPAGSSGTATDLGGMSSGGSSAAGNPSAGQGARTGNDGGAGGSSLSRAIYFPSTLGPREDLVLCKEGACPDNQRCFQITSEFGLCAPATFPEATQCSPPSGFGNEMPDECGCGGLRCPNAQRCRLAQKFCSCGADNYNDCVEAPCNTAADCGDDICVPSTWIWGSRCVKPQCRSDVDCNAHPGMRCIAVLSMPQQQGNNSFDGTLCVYNERPAVSDTCTFVREYAADAFGCD